MNRGYDDPTLAAEHAAKVAEHEQLIRRAGHVGAAIALVIGALLVAASIIVVAIIAGVLAHVAWDLVRLGWGL